MEKVSALRLSADGAGLLLGTDAGRVMRLVLPKAIERVRAGTGRAVSALAMEEDAIVVGDRRGRVQVCAQGQVAAEFSCETEVIQLLPLGHDRYLSLEAVRRALLWRPDEAGALQSEPLRDDGEPLKVDALAGPEGDGLVVLRKGFGWLLWDPRQARVVGSFEAVDARHLLYDDGCMGPSRSGSLFFLYWDDYQVFDARSGEELWLAPTPYPPLCGALSNDGEVLASGDYKGWVRAIRPDGSAAAEVQVTATAVIDVDISADGAVAAWRDRAGQAGVVELAGGTKLLTAQELAELLAAV